MMDQKLINKDPKVLKKRHLIFQAVIIFCLIAFAVLAYFSKTHPYFSLDLIITQFIQNIQLAFFRNLMLGLSQLGNGWLSIITVTMVLSSLFFLDKKKEALVLLISLVGEAIITLIFKILVARPRPDPNLITQIGHFVRHDSFPSGHVLFFISFYGFLLFLIFLLFKPGMVKWLVMTILASMIVLIGVSRIYLGAHWFSDTLGAYLIGTTWLYGVTLIYKKIKF